MKFESVTVMMPAVNETNSLWQTVKTIEEICPAGDIGELIIMLSKTATPECRAVSEKLRDEIKAFPVIVATQEMPGLGGAIRECMAAAKCSHTMLVACDAPMDLKCVNAMIFSAKQAPEVIATTSRWLTRDFEGYGKARLVLNYLAQVFLRVLYGSNQTDFTNPVQIVPTKLYQSIRWEETRFAILLEMVLKPVRLGCEFREIPVECRNRSEGKSSNSFLQTAEYLKTALRIRFMKKSDILISGENDENTLC